MTRHCHACGWTWTLEGQPGRSESCHQCRADLKVCLNCIHHDLRAAHQCRERRAEPVHDKNLANFCEYFEMARREWRGTNPDARAQKARDAFDRLFGD